MVKQLKAVFGNSVTYGSWTPGSRYVTTFWKYKGSFQVEQTEVKKMRVGETFPQFMANEFLGEVLPVTGLPGHR